MCSLRARAWCARIIFRSSVSADAGSGRRVWPPPPLVIRSRHTKGPATVLVLAITCMRVFPQDTPSVSSAAGTEELQQCGILPARGIISGCRAGEKEPTVEVDMESQLRRCRYCICSTYNGRAVGLFHILFFAGTTVSYYFKC